MQSTLRAVADFYAAVTAAPGAGDIRAAGARAFVTLLREHPAFATGAPPVVALPVHGGAADPVSQDYRTDAAEILVMGAAALRFTGDAGVGDDVSTLQHVAVGAGAFNATLRDILRVTRCATPSSGACRRSNSKYVST